MYYPPEWRPEHGDLDKFHGGHKLGNQAKKIDQGILDVRIELPFPIWCLGCKRKFAMGVRYTAEKFMVGKYLSTPIYKFKMKCHMCPQMLEMRTDPQNFDYLCVSGCRRDIRTWDMEDNGQVAFTDSAERARIDTDPMYKLEKAKSDKNVHEDRKPDLKRIQIDNFQKMGDNFELNRALRAGLRYAKKMDAGPTADETAFAKVLAASNVKQIGEKKVATLSGAKRTLSASKLGIAKKSKHAGPSPITKMAPPNPVPESIPESVPVKPVAQKPSALASLCSYSDSDSD